MSFFGIREFCRLARLNDSKVSWENVGYDLNRETTGRGAISQRSLAIVHGQSASSSLFSQLQT